MKIGSVTHYYDKIGVAIVELIAPLHIGDRVKVSGSAEFSQVVSSMQVEHSQVEFAKSGDTIGLKVQRPVRPKDEIVKIS